MRQANIKKCLIRAREIPPVFYMMAIGVVLFTIWGENFLTVGNISNILIQASPLLVLSIGQTLIILMGGTDLSLGYTMSFVGLMSAYALKAGIPVIFVIIWGIFIGGVIGSINGFFISNYRLPYFICTYGVGNVFFGLGLLLSGGISVPALNRSFRYLADGKLFGKIPIVILIAFGIFLLMKVLMDKTSLGRDVHGLGGNREALYLAGVNVKRAEFTSFLITGLLAGCAGVLFCARSASGHPSSGVGWEFDAVAASVIGGNSFIGGRGSLNRTILGVIFLCLLRNGLNMIGIHTRFQSTVVGIVVVLAISIDSLIQRSEEEKKP